MKFHITLRLRLVLLVMAAIVPLLALSVAKAVWKTDDALQRAKGELALSAALVAANHEQVSEAARQLLESVALAMAQAGSGAECHSYFRSLGERLPQYALLGIANLDGNIVCDNIKPGRGVGIGDRPYFRNALNSRSFSAGSYTFGRRSGIASVHFALPVKSTDGAVTAIAFVGLNLQALTSLIASIPVPPGGRVLVTDRDGLVLAVNPAMPEMIGSLVENPMLQSMVKNKSTGVQTGQDARGAERIFAFQPAGQSQASPFFVAISADRNMAVGPAQQELMVELGGLLAVAFIGGLLAWMVGGQGIVRPANSILAAIRRIQRGERGVRIPVERRSASNELSRMADGFNLMADSLQQRDDDLQAELVRSRHAYDTLQLTINSMKEGLIAVDTSGRLLLYNQAAATIFLLDGAPLALSSDWPRYHGLYMPGTDHLYTTDSLPLAKALAGKSGSTQHIWVRNAMHPQGRLISASFRPMMGEPGTNGEASVIGALMVFADITRLQQMQMEQAKSFIELRETQRRLLEAQRLGRMGSWEYDLSTKKMWWSDEMFELFGLERDTFDGQHETLVAMIHPDDRENYTTSLATARRAGTNFEVECRIVTPAGQTRWIYQLGSPRVGHQGMVTTRSGVIQDITARKQPELALIKSYAEQAQTQRKLNDALRLGRIGHWEINFATQLVWWSSELYELLGFEPGSFDGRPESFLGLIHPQDVCSFDAQRIAAWNAGIECEAEFRILTPAGVVLWVHQVCKSHFDADNRPTHRSGLLQDITPRKQAELALQASYDSLADAQDKLIAAQKIGRIGNWEFNLVTGAFTASAQVYAICGVVDRVLGRADLLELMHPEDRESYLSAMAVADADPNEFEFDTQYRLITPAGGVLWIHQMARIERDASGQVIRRIGVIQDITENQQDKLALANNLGLLKRTGELAKVGGWEFDVDSARLVYSDQLRSIYELEAGEEHTLESARLAYPVEVRQQFMDAIHAARQSGRRWDLELPLTTRRGRQRWVRTQGQAEWANGRIARLVGTVQDITEQYQSRKQLRLLQTCMNQLQDVVMVTEANPDAVRSEPGVVYVNEAFERFTGYSPQEMLGQSPMLLNGPMTERSALRGVVDAFKQQHAHRTELLSYNKQGEGVLIELDVVPIFSAVRQVTHWVWVARDLTSRKLAEQSLMDSEQRYMALFESAPLPLWVFDDTTLQFLTVNTAAIEQYGFSREEFLTMTLMDIRHERERAWAQAHFRKPLTGEAVVVMHRKKNGQEFPVQVVARPIQYEGRSARLVVALDVSARVKAEKDVQDQLFTLQRAADAAQAITSQQTLKAALQEVADQACGVIGAHQALVMLAEGGEWGPSIYGLSLSEKYAKYRTLSDPVDGSGIYAMVFETKRPIRLTQAELEAHPRWKGFGAYADKHPAMRGWLAVPLLGRGGQSIGVLQLSDKFEGEFTLQDEYVVLELAQLASTALENARLFDEIHRLNLGLEQKVAERTEALSRQEALFRTLSDQAPQAIWTLDRQGEATYFNRAFIELVGGESRQWMGMGWLPLMHPEDLAGVLDGWHAAKKQRVRYNNIRRLRGQDGTWHIMSCTASPVFNASGEVDFWVGIDADITDIKAVEAALRLSNQELEAFSYSVSHDLRSPLNTVDGFSRLLAKQLSAEANEKSRHYLSRIQAGVAQMGQLIEDLLSLAQVSRLQLRIEPVNLSAMAQTVVDEWRVRAPARAVQVRIEPGLHAQGDARLLRVVLENLLGNAWKFTSQQERAEITVGQTQEADNVPTFFVRDNGAGFDMAYADKLFTAFQRLHGAQEFPGSGIGLATVSRVIDRHGGRLWADAKPNEGACFYFTVPGSAASASSMSAQLR